MYGLKQMNEPFWARVWYPYGSALIRHSYQENSIEGGRNGDR